MVAPTTPLEPALLASRLLDAIGCQNIAARQAIARQLRALIAPPHHPDPLTEERLELLEAIAALPHRRLSAAYTRLLYHLASPLLSAPA